MLIIIDSFLKNKVAYMNIDFDWKYSESYQII